MDPAWEEKAFTALSEDQAPIKANASTMARVGAGIAAAIGVIGPAIVAAIKGLEQATLLPVAVALAASVLALAIIVASDFRTRGQVTRARFEALVQMALSARAQDERDESTGASDGATSGADGDGLATVQTATTTETTE